MHMLDEILKNKIREVADKKIRVSVEDLKRKAGQARKTRDFAAALAEPGISLIAEVKRKSPSKGELRIPFDPLAIARTYAHYGARAISVLADEKFFGGSAQVVSLIAHDDQISLPVMYKDFIIDPYQVYEARANGADAILVIIRAADPVVLKEIFQTAHGLGMDVLTETFTPEEVEIALEAGARIVGINNRDLQTFQVDLAKSKEMKGLVPEGKLTVSESGLNTRADVLQAEKSGFDGMLVGEALVKSPDIAGKIQDMMGVQHRLKLGGR